MNAATTALRPSPEPGQHPGTSDKGRYADMRDRRLAATLLAEDRAEDAGLDPFERINCRVHRRWLHHCISSPVHVVQGLRAPLVPAVRGAGRCRGRRADRGRPHHVRPVRARPSGATQQIVRTCTGSLAAAQGR